MVCLGSELEYKQSYLQIIHRVETSITDHVTTGGSHEEGNRVGLDSLSFLSGFSDRVEVIWIFKRIQFLE